MPDGTARAIADLAEAGLDLVHAFAAHAITTPGWERLRTGPTRGLLIANTRALWPAFTARSFEGPNPLDAYVERAVDAAFPGAPIYYAHRRYDDAFLPFQHLAIAVGLGALSPGQLVVHPIYGPWIGIRAVVLLPGDAPIRAPIAKPCECVECPAALDAALADPHDWRRWLAVRDACSLREHRYSDEQIRFHYAGAWATSVG